MRKQMTYANNNRIPFVALVGEKEMREGIIGLKNMICGNNETARCGS